MKSQLRRFAWTGGLIVTLCVAAMAAQKKDTKAKRNPPAASQAATTHPATHFTQGTIASIDASQLVVNHKVHGKAKQDTFMLNSQTQRTGDLAAGDRVSVQYREDNSQKIATALREVGGKPANKPAKRESKSRSKS